MRLYVGLGRARASRYFCQVMTIFPWNSKRLPRILNQRHILKCVLVKFGDSSRNVSIILYKAYSVPTYIPPALIPGFRLRFRGWPTSFAKKFSFSDGSVCGLENTTPSLSWSDLVFVDHLSQQTLLLLYQFVARLPF